MPADTTHYLYTDGGARGNPGPAAIGIVLTDKSGTVLEEYSQWIGRATNNIAEYTALIKGLEIAWHRKVTHLVCVLDSELVVKQLQGEYRIKSPHLAELFHKVKTLAHMFQKVTFQHAQRTHPWIRHADRLVNQALNAAEKSAFQMPKGTEE